MREEKTAVSKSGNHHDADDGSVFTHASYSTSYTATSRKTMKSMKLSNSASALNERILSDNVILDNVLEGISAMTNYLEGNEQKRTTLEDLAKSRINLEDCMKLKEQIREKIRNSKREKRTNLFTSEGVSIFGDDVSMITTDSSEQISYMRKTRSPRRSRSPDGRSVISSSLFLTDDDREEMQNAVTPVQSIKRILQQPKLRQKKKMITQKGTDENVTVTINASKNFKHSIDHKAPVRPLVPLKPSVLPVKPISVHSNLLRSTASLARQQSLTLSTSQDGVGVALGVGVEPSTHVFSDLAVPIPVKSVLGTVAKSVGPTLSTAKNAEWVERQLEWRMNIEMRNRSAKKAHEQESIRFMQHGPDMKKSQQSWERLKKSHAIQSHFDSENKHNDDEELSVLSSISMDTSHSLKLQKLNADMQKLIEAKRLNEMGVYATKKRSKKKTDESACVDDFSVHQSKATEMCARNETSALDLIESDGTAAVQLSTSTQTQNADDEEEDELRSFGSDDESARHGDRRYTVSVGDSDYDSGAESDDNNSTYTADQSVLRDMPPLHMKVKDTEDFEDEDCDDHLYLPTYASEFGTPRPWSLLPEEEKRKIALRTEKRNRGLDLYAVKHTAGLNSSSATGRNDLIVSTNRSDMSDYEEGWDKANEKLKEFNLERLSQSKDSVDPEVQYTNIMYEKSEDDGNNEILITS